MQKIIVAVLLLSFTSVFAQKINYREQHRPQYHFSPAAHWMNDPNGMVYYKGEYHLFYQHYPDSTVWGPMHWGHAVSKDLVHWKHLPIALYPDSLGLIFSGSVVVDQNNSSGLQKGIEKPLVALYTYHDLQKERAGVANDFQYQGMAYSIDKGRTWKKYEHNPVIKNNGSRDFRDPKVFWHQPSMHWVMVLAVADKVEFYRSKNLKEWEYTGTFGKEDGSHGGVWECPDLFEMKAEGTNKKKWVLIVSIGNGGPNGGSATQYFVGDFNGSTFINDNSKETVHWLDYGADDYAGVTWSNTGNKKLFLGWMSNWNYAQVVPTKSWRSAMTLPRELFLQKTASGYRVFAKPVDQLVGLRRSQDSIGFEKAIRTKGLAEMELAFDLSQSDASDVGVSFSNSKNEMLKIGYNKKANEFYIDRSKAGDNSFSEKFVATCTAPRLVKDKAIKLHLFIDHSSVEVFADDGSVVLTAVFFPKELLSSVQLYADKKKDILLEKRALYQLGAAW